MRDISGNVVKKSETYEVIDNTELNNLVLSSTRLYNGRETTGHRHDGQEEIYFFIEGAGTIQVDEVLTPVEAGSIILIPDGAFHKVFADRGEEVYFLCVFDGRRD